MYVSDPASPGETRNTVEAAGDKVPAALATTLTETAASDAAKALDEAINVVSVDLFFDQFEGTSRLYILTFVRVHICLQFASHF